MAGRIIGGVCAAAIVAVSWQMLGTDQASACSTGPDFNPVAESDVVVGGYITSFEITGQPGVGAYARVLLTMEVEAVHRGEASDVIIIDDNRSLIAQPTEDGRPVWAPGGSCGAFNFDPVGSYAILGLNVYAGRYTASGPSTFFIGEGPSGAEYENALARIEELSADMALPDTGSRATSNGNGNAWLLFVAAAGTLTAITGVAVAVSMRRRSTA